MPAAGPHSMIGQTLSERYLVTAKLGEGGMGSVYKAQDLKLDADVVIKVPHPVMIKDPDFASRFRHEIRSLVKLSHAHIVKVMDVGVHDGLPFAVMQYLSGGSLEDWNVPAEPVTLLDWLGDIADALDFMHGRGLIHRDIKPANIFIDESGRACLGDFGIAKVVAAGEESDQKGLTGTGMAIGTAEYMAPEMLMPDLYGGEYDARVDQYALAVTVYEMLAGRSPFEGDTMATVAVKLTQTEAPPLHVYQASIPEALSQVVARALAKAPQDRYASCREFADAVSAAVQGRTSRRTSVAEQLSRPSPQARHTTAATQPNVPTRQATAPGGPLRTMQERRRPTPQGATVAESRPGAQGTLREEIPRGIDEVFVEVDVNSTNAGKPQSRQLIDWLKSPIGIASSVGGALFLLLTGIALSQLGGTDEEEPTVAEKSVAVAANESIEQKPAESPRSGTVEPDAGEAGGASERSAGQRAVPQVDSEMVALVKSLERGVVRINADLAVGSAVGNGFVVDASGLIVTNYHVVQGARSARVTFSNGTSKQIQGYRFTSSEMDIAILQLAQPVGSLDAVPLADTLPERGSFSATVGSVVGQPLTSSSGIVESIRKASPNEKTRQGTWIRTTSAVSPDISGGPLVSRDGLVIGVNTWSDSAARDGNLAISSVDLRKVIESSKFRQIVPLTVPPRTTSRPQANRFAGTFRTTPRAFSSSQAKLFEDIWFGADGVDLSTRDQNLLRRAGLRTRTGFFLTIVTYGSPAYKAGLREKDIIKSVNGNFVSTVEDLSKVVNVAKPGQTLKIEALKTSSKGRYQAKASRLEVTVRGVIPQSAIDTVLEADCPDPAKEFLLLQLLNYGEMLSSACRRATKGSEKDQQRVDSILNAGPFDPVHAPNLSDYSFVKLGIIGRADNVTIKEIVGDKYTLFKSGITEMLFAGVPAGAFKGSRTDFGVVQIVKTTNYTTENGVKKSTFVAERFDIGPFLPKGQDVGARLGEEFKRNERQTDRRDTNSVVRDAINATASRRNLSGVWESTNGDSIFQVIDSGNSVIVRLVSSDTIESLTGLLTRNGNTLTARTWQGVFKKDPARRRHNLQFSATVNSNDSLTIRFTNILWDGTGRVVSQQFDGRGTWSKLSAAEARAALAGSRED